MPMCAFIPIAAQSLSLSLHVKCTGIFLKGEGGVCYHRLIKDALTRVKRQHEFRQQKRQSVLVR